MCLKQRTCFTIISYISIIINVILSQVDRRTSAVWKYANGDRYAPFGALCKGVKRGSQLRSMYGSEAKRGKHIEQKKSRSRRIIHNARKLCSIKMILSCLQKNFFLPSSSNISTKCSTNPDLPSSPPYISKPLLCPSCPPHHLLSSLHFLTPLF